jgi:hypothetical protein
MAECKSYLSSEYTEQQTVEGETIFLINTPKKPCCADKASNFKFSFIDLDFLNNNRINIII